MDIVHLVQSAVAPVFLLSGVAATLAVLTNRLARAVDRARALEERLEKHIGNAKHLHEELVVLARRARYINAAISLCAVSALLVTLVVVTLFASAFFGAGLAAIGRGSIGKGLPGKLKAGIENLSGLAMDDVKVHHNSAKPAELQSLAHTRGTGP